jgi:hypothetical protein
VVRSLKATIEKSVFTSKRLCVYGKIKLENTAKKCPRIKEMETSLTLGQFVGARMGGVLPQHFVSQIH